MKILVKSAGGKSQFRVSSQAGWIGNEVMCEEHDGEKAQPRAGVPDVVQELPAGAFLNGRDCFGAGYGP
ncbi:MAG: hypothetical protein P8Z49_01665 [Acidobacteriota bacterium]